MFCNGIIRDAAPEVSLKVAMQKVGYSLPKDSAEEGSSFDWTQSKKDTTRDISAMNFDIQCRPLRYHVLLYPYYLAAGADIALFTAAACVIKISISSGIPLSGALRRLMA